MSRVRFIFCLWIVALCFNTNAADTNSLVWHTAANRVDADIHGEPLWPLLENMARQTGWRIYVEPGTSRNTSAKFQDLPSDSALRMLLGDLNFALVPQSNAPTHLYVFRTVRQNATRLVRANVPVKHVPNELLVKLKPGTDVDALAKLLGAKVIGRMDKLGIYRLQFADADATDVALGKLQSDSDVEDVDYNYYLDPPPPIQSLASGSAPPLNLQLNPPPDSGKIVVGLLDTSVQSLGPDLDKFILKQLSDAGDAPPDSSSIEHGTAMAYTILQAIALASGGNSSVQILPVNVYGTGEATTTWNVAAGIPLAVNNGANILNLSLSGPADSTILDDVIEAAVNDGVMIFAAPGNQPISTPTYPAAIPGVIPVTALGSPGQLAPYANYWPDPSMIALPGNSFVSFDGLTYFVQGTSVSTANATGVAAGNAGANHMTWPQIQTAMQQKFAVPQK